ncbi:MAG: hypothetical protein ACM3KM_00400 [Acidobacteriaceae bacterium]
MKKFFSGLKYFLLALAVVIAAVLAYFYFSFHPTKNPEWGISFSRSHAEYLGYDWKVMYLDILNDLKPKKLRLMAYWRTMETEKDLWYFQDVDEMLVEADKRNIDVTLAVGKKLPRWPECHQPAWVNSLSPEEQKARQLHMVEMAVSHFKQFNSIKAWQIENEALFNFGPECPVIDKETFRQEIEIVRRLDSRPIILTDSGELGRWVPTARFGPDIFGSTMYRVIYHKKIGYFRYPLPPAFFRIKAGIAKFYTGVDRFTGVELQAEPWFNTDVQLTDIETQRGLMNPVIFKQNVDYARRVGLEDNYFWGVEWWYWMAHNQNDWGMWDAARQVLSQ